VWPGAAGSRLERAAGQVARVVPGCYLFTRAREDISRRGARHGVGQTGQLAAPQQLVDRRQGPKLHA
jgi:hypothetical protein